MPSDRPTLPRETHTALLTRGAAYSPALAFEVREMKPTVSRLTNIILDLLALVAVAAWGGAIILLVLLSSHSL